VNSFQYFFWLATQVWSGITFSWQTSLIVIVVAFIGLILNNPFAPSKYSYKNLLLLAPFGITFLILLIGTVFVHNDPHLRAPQWPTLLLIVIALSHIPLTILLVIKMKGFRLATIALNALQIWCSWQGCPSPETGFRKSNLPTSGLRLRR